MPPHLPAPHHVLTDFLRPEEHSALLTWTLENESRFSPGLIAGGVVDRNHKRCEKLDDLGPSAALLSRRIRTEYVDWTKQMRLSAFELGLLELQLAAYPDQAHFAFHTDATLSSSLHAGRALTAIYYFYREPKRFAGGALRLFNIGAGPESSDFKTIEPQQNTLVVFPSWIGHDVTLVTIPTQHFADSRFAVNCWLNRLQR